MEWNRYWKLTPIPFLNQFSFFGLLPELVLQSDISEYLGFFIKLFIKNFRYLFYESRNYRFTQQLSGLNNTVFKTLSIQELFDLRNDILDLMNKLAELLKE